MKEKKSPEEQCAALENLIAEARSEAQYYRHIASETGKRHLREIDQVSKLVSELKQSEKARRKSEERYRDLVENINDVIYSLDMCGVITYVSPVVETVLGFSPSEMIGKNLQEFVHNEDLASQQEDYQNITPDSSLTKEYRVMARAGEYRWLRASIRPIYSNNHLVGIRGVFSDVTETKNLEAQFLQAQKMQALGTIAGGISHNFRNILAVISAHMQIITMKYEDHPHLLEISSVVGNYVKRGAQLIDSLMNFSRKEKKKNPQRVRLDELIEETCQIISESFDKNILLTRNVPDALPFIADPATIGQAIMNICINARDAMPEGGELNIEGARQGEKVVVRFSDTGHGMEKEIREQCFDPFFTTKDVGKGTGLGLSTVLGTVEAYGGDIGVESEAGSGTTFTMTFPLAPPVANGMEKASPAIQTGKGQKVLVVDDEIEICRVMEQFLAFLGYQGSSECSGKAAIDTYRTLRPDVVLLDRSMPGMDGMSCAEEILDFDPDASIVVISGYDKDGPSGMDERDRGLIKGYITKPVDMAALGSLLASLFTT